MQKKNSSRNVFDEIDKDMEQVKTAMKSSRQKQVLKTQIKALKGLIVILFISSLGFICLGIFDELNIADVLMGMICLISAVYCLVLLKIISKPQTKKGDKR